MTREDAKKMFKDDKNSQGCYKAVLTKIDAIYDDFEKTLDSAIILGNIPCKECNKTTFCKIPERDIFECNHCGHPSTNAEIGL